MFVVNVAESPEVVLDFKNDQQVALAVHFFPDTKHSSAGTTVRSMSELTVELSSLTLKPVQ